MERDRLVNQAIYLDRTALQNCAPVLGWWLTSEQMIELACAREERFAKVHAFEKRELLRTLPPATGWRGFIVIKKWLRFLVRR